MIFRLDTFVRGPSLRSSRLISVLTFSLEVFRFGNFLVGSFVWELSLGVLRLIHSVWDVSLWGLSFRIFRKRCLRSSALTLSIGSYWLISFAWKLSRDNCRLEAFVRYPSFGAFDLTLSFEAFAL